MSDKGTRGDDLLHSRFGFCPSADVIARMSPDARAALGIDKGPGAGAISDEATSASSQEPEAAPALAEPAPLSRMARRAERDAVPEPEPSAPVPHWVRVFAWGSGALITLCAAWIVWMVWMPHPSPRPKTPLNNASAPEASAIPAEQPTTSAPAVSTPVKDQTPGPAPLSPANGQTVEQSAQQSRQTPAQTAQQPVPQQTQPAPPPHGTQDDGPKLLHVSGWACEPLTGGQNCGPLIDDGQGHLVQVLPAPGVTCDINGRCNPPNCPPILQGRVTLVGNRIRVQVGVSGPAGFTQTPALIDTGAGITILPKAVLDAAGYRPVGAGAPLYGVSDTPITAFPYKVLAPYVQDGDRWASLSLSPASVTIYGVDGGSFASEGLIGPELLRASRLTVQGNAWALSLPCGN